MRGRRRYWAVVGSIRTRLAVFFFLITLIAVAVVYVYAVPSLQSRLQQQQLKDVAKVARSKTGQALAEHLLRDATELANLKAPSRPVRFYGERKAEWSKAQALYARRRLEFRARHTSLINAANNAAAKLDLVTGANTLTLLEFQRAANGGTGPAEPSVVYPQNSASAASIDDIAGQTFATGKASNSAYNSSLGLVAEPLPKTTFVLVYGVTFGDVRSDVTLIRTRILVAAAIALAVVLLLGVLVARALTVRVLRLERAAQRVAQGDLTAQFEVDSNDELGQLAAALAHMQGQLRQLEEARRRFIATASHELRTPIFSLGGFLELIQDEELDEETRRSFVGQVREQVARLGRLATGLLDLSRLEAGSVALDPTPTDIGVLSRVVAGEFLPALALHESELDLVLPQAPLRAMVDPERVAQLLRILIDNAITHTPPGTPLTVAVEDGDGTVKLRVTDAGHGIPSDVVPRIFEPFYTADGTRGAGLGLAIARELAERLEATLEVQSSEAGTAFTLTLRDDQSGGGE